MSITSYVRPIIMPVVTYPHGSFASGQLTQASIIMVSLLFIGFLVALLGVGISIYDELSDDGIDKERGDFIAIAGLILASVGVLYMLAYSIIKAI